MKRSVNIIPIVIILCVGVFCAQMLYPEITKQFSIIPFNFFHGEWWRILTGCFLHSSLMHLFANMYAFYNLAEFVEEAYGNKVLLFVLLFSCLTSGLAICFIGDQFTNTIGLSGGIFGLLCFYISHLVRRKLIEIPYVRDSVIQILLPNIIISFMPGVSLLGHLGGFIGGFSAGFLIKG